MNRIIFLDFDGVLTNMNTKFRTADPLCVRRLNCITRASLAHIVVSSSWRKGGHDKTELQLQEWGVTGELAGITPDLAEFENGLWKSHERGDEIADWLRRHPDVTEFVILDDDADMGALLDHLVRTDTHNGLSAANAKEAIRRLCHKELIP